MARRMNSGCGRPCGDLQKIAGYGRSKPLLAKAIYVSAPETPPKQRFRTREALVIKQFGAF